MVVILLHRSVTIRMLSALGSYVKMQDVQKVKEKTMAKKLSEALLEGATKVKQKTGSLYGFDGNGKLVQACALGAIDLDGNPLENFVASNYGGLKTRYPELNKTIVTKFKGKKRETTLESIIWQRNDVQRWSFKQIAVWLRSIGH